MAKRIVTTGPKATPTNTPTNTAPTVGATVAAIALAPAQPIVAPGASATVPSVANANWVLPATGGSRKAPPAPHTVYGMLCALLANGPAPLAQCALAVANAQSTGKPHSLLPLLRYAAAKWGQGWVCTNGMLYYAQ